MMGNRVWTDLFWTVLELETAWYQPSRTPRPLLSSRISTVILQIGNFESYKMLAMLRRIFSKSIGSSSISVPSIFHSFVPSFNTAPLSGTHISKFILQNSSFGYKDRLINLHLLPPMMEFEISDILFLVKSIKYPSDHFDILLFINQPLSPSHQIYTS